MFIQLFVDMFSSFDSRIAHMSADFPHSIYIPTHTVPAINTFHSITAYITSSVIFVLNMSTNFLTYNFFVVWTMNGILDNTHEIVILTLLFPI